MGEVNGLREDCILASPSSWPPSSCVHGSQKSGVWGGAFIPHSHNSYLSLVTFNLNLLHTNCNHIGGAGRAF